MQRSAALALSPNRWAPRSPQRTYALANGGLGPGPGVRGRVRAGLGAGARGERYRLGDWPLGQGARARCYGGERESAAVQGFGGGWRLVLVRGDWPLGAGRGVRNRGRGCACVWAGGWGSGPKARATGRWVCGNIKSSLEKMIKRITKAKFETLAGLYPWLDELPNLS